MERHVIMMSSIPAAGNASDDYPTRMLASEGACGKSARALAAARIARAEEANLAKLDIAISKVNPTRTPAAYERLVMRRAQASTTVLKAVSLIAALHGELPAGLVFKEQ